MTRTFTGAIVRVDGMRADTSALAGLQPKVGATRTRGRGVITSLAVVDDGTPGVVVDPLGAVPLAWVREVDGAPADHDALTAWWWGELAAWVQRKGGAVSDDRAELLATATRLRGVR